MEQSPTHQFTRREALKALAAATGAVVLSNLPVEWKTPIVEIGAVPAHAQGGSGPAPVVSQLRGFWQYPNGTDLAPRNQPKVNGPACIVTVYFNYQDSLGQVSGNSTVVGTYNFNQSFGGSVGSGMNGTGFAGSITFPFNSTYCMFGNASVSVQLSVNGRLSNVTNGTVMSPPA